MVKIRLSRSGAKKTPFYHIVATDQRNRRDGRYLERLGFYNPVAKGQAVRLQLDESRIEHWVGVGAQVSDRVTTLRKAHAHMVANDGAWPESRNKVNKAKKRAAADQAKQDEAKAAAAEKEAEEKAAAKAAAEEAKAAEAEAASAEAEASEAAPAEEAKDES